MFPGSPSCFPSPTLPIPCPRHSNVRPDVPVHHGAGSAGRGCPEFTHVSRETEGTEPRVYTELLQAHPRQAWRPRGADGRHRGGNRKVGTHDEAAGFRREASSRGWREATATRAAHKAAEGVSRRDVGQPGDPSVQRVSTASGRGRGAAAPTARPVQTKGSAESLFPARGREPRPRSPGQSTGRPRGAGAGPGTPLVAFDSSSLKEKRVRSRYEKITGWERMSPARAAQTTEPSQP